MNPNSVIRRYELQPVPDYLRWLKTGEAHYLPLEETAVLKGTWVDIPSIFLPTKVLDLCFTVLQSPTEMIINQICLLSWVTPQEAREYQKKIEDQLQSQLMSEKEKEKWKSHELYCNKTKAQLEVLCKNLNIPVTSALLKHQLVRLIVEKKGEDPPGDPPIGTIYAGDLSAIPATTTGINRLSIAYLKSVLLYHNLPAIGRKEQLVLRTYLLRHNRMADVVAREEGQLKDLISIAQKIILEQRRLSFTSHVYRTRKYTLQPNKSKFIPVPSHIRTEEDLNILFKPLLEHIDHEHKRREEQVLPVLPPPHYKGSRECSDAELQEQIIQTGSKVKVKWTAGELEGTDWKGGWYKATVNSYCSETDMLTLTYVSEPGIPYEEELMPLLSNNKIKLLWSPM